MRRDVTKDDIITADDINQAVAKSVMDETPERIPLRRGSIVSRPGWHGEASVDYADDSETEVIPFEQVFGSRY